MTPKDRTGRAAGAAGARALALALAAGCAAAATALLPAGCERRYERQALGLDSPQARQVQAMLDDLRQAGPDGWHGRLAQQWAAPLSADQQAAVAQALRPAVEAADARLSAFDRFGARVYRASIDWSTAGGARGTGVMLLVEQQDRLAWAGPN